MRSISSVLLFVLVFTLLSSFCLGFGSVNKDVPEGSFSSSLLVSNPTNCNQTETCVGKGASCKGNSPTANGCAMGLYCSGATATEDGTCITDNIGDSCNTTSQCFPLLTTSCQNKTCEYLMNDGDPCTSNENCKNGNCANGTCFVQSYGGVCFDIINSDSFTCAFGLYCEPSLQLNSTCQNTTKSGGNCTHSAECYPGTLCFASKAGGQTTCQTVGSQGSGGPCVQGACGEGYACPYEGNLTCMSVNTDIVQCTNATDCPGGDCVCSHYVGEAICAGSPVYNNPCTQEEIDLATCTANNKCLMESEIPGSCCQENCESEYKKLRSCACSILKSTIGDCYYDSYCGGFPVWAIIVIIVAVIAVILAVVVVVIFYLRHKKRRQYESI